MVIRPFTIPNFSCKTLANGAKQLVVQDALDIILCFDASYLSWLTPITIVISSFVAGAEINTFFTVPEICAFALLPSV